MSISVKLVLKVGVQSAWNQKLWLWIVKFSVNWFFSMCLSLLWHWLKSWCYVLSYDLFLLTWLIMRYFSCAVFVTGSVFTDFVWYLTQPFNPIVLGSPWTSLPHTTSVHPSGDMWPVFQQRNKQVEIGLLFQVLPGIFTIM